MFFTGKHTTQDIVKSWAMLHRRSQVAGGTGAGGVVHAKKSIDGGEVFVGLKLSPLVLERAAEHYSSDRTVNKSLKTYKNSARQARFPISFLSPCPKEGRCEGEERALPWRGPFRSESAPESASRPARIRKNLKERD